MNYQEMNKQELIEALYKLRKDYESIRTKNEKDNELALKPVSTSAVGQEENAGSRLKVFMGAVDNASDAIGMSTPEGKHYYQNKAFDKLFGAVGENPPATLYVDEQVGRGVFSTLMSGNQWTGEVKMFAADKSVVDINLNAYAALDENNQIVALVGVHTDISERKKNAKTLDLSLLKYKTLFDSFPLGITVADHTGKIVESNKTAEHLLGLSPEEQKMRKIAGEEWKIIRPDGSPMPAEEFASVRALKEGKLIENVEMGIVKAEDNITWINVNSMPVQLDEPSLVITYGDITERKKAEREHEALLLMEKSVRRELNTLLDRISDGFVAFDNKMNFTFMNEAGGQLLGRKPEELIGRNYWDEYPEARDTPFANAYLKALETLETVFIEEHYEPWDRWFSNTIYPSHNGISVIFQEITERRKSEIQNQERQGLIAATLRSIGEALISTRADGIISMMNPVAETLTGWKTEDAQGKHIDEIFNIVNAKTGEKVANPVDRSLKEGLVAGLANHTRLISRDGTEYQIADSCSPIKDDKNNILGAVLVFRDVTKEYLQREELARSYQAIKHSINGIVLTDLTGKISFVNKAFIEMHGFTDESELLGKQSELFWQNPEEFLKTVELLKKMRSFSGEARIKRKDGLFFDSLFSSSLIFDTDENPIGLFASILDISERKQVEETLQKNQGFIAATLNSIGEALISTDELGMIAMMNPVAEALTGWKLEDAKGRHIEKIFNIVNAKTGEKAFNPVKRSLKEGVIVGLANHTKLISRDATEYQIADSCAPIKDEKGNILGAVLVFRDVTEEYRQRESLTISDQAIRNSINGVAISNLSGNLTFVNEAFVKLWGYKDDAGILGKPADGFWENRDEARFVIQQIIEHGFYSGELISKKADGTLADIHLSASFIKGSDDTPIAMVGSFIDITERKKAQQRVERLSRIVADSLNEVYLFEEHSLKFIEVNKAALSNLGYSIEEILGMTPVDIKPEFSKNDFRKMIEPLASGEKDLLVFETLHQRRDGTQYPVQANLQKLTFDHETFYAAIILDITERKQSEAAHQASEERLKLALWAAQQGIYDLNIQTGDAIVTPEYATMLGYDPEEFHETNAAWIERLHPDDHEHSGKIYRDYIAGLLPEYRVEFRQLTKSGHYKWILSLGKIVEYDATGNPLRMLGTHTDITERKQAEDKLRESNEILSTFMKHSPIYAYVKEVTPAMSRVLMASENFRDMTGIPGSEMAGKTMHELFPADFAAKITADDWATVSNGQVLLLDEHLNGRAYTTIKFPIKKDGKTLLAGYTLDITEREKAKEALGKSEERFKLAMNASNDGLFDWNLETNEIYYSPGWKKMLGYEDHEIANDFSVWENTTDPEDVRKSWEMQQKLINKQLDRFVLEFKMKHKEGHWVEILSRAEAFFDENGKAIRIVGTHSDITERKHAEDAMLESENRLKLFIEHAPASLAMFDREMNYIAYSNRWLTDYELDGTDIRGKSHYDVFPEISDYLKMIHQRAMQGEVVNREEDKFERADGTIQWLRWEVRPWLTVSGSIGGIVIFSEDISARKQAEQALRESEALIRAVIDNLPIGLAVNSVDPAIRFEYMNDNFTALYGTTRDALSKADSFWEAVYEDKAYREEIRKKVLDAIASGDPARMHWEDIPITGKGKETRYVWARNTPIPGKSLMISTVWDVTEKKMAEKALRESERKYRLLFDSNPHPMWVYDLETLSFLAVNDAAVNKYGYTKDEFMAMTIRQIRPEEDLPRLEENIKTVSEGIDEAGVWRHITKGGTTIYVEIVSHTLTFEDHKAEMVLANDVTDRLKARDALLASEHRFQTFMNNTPVLAYIKDETLSHIYKNRSIAELMENTGIRGYHDSLKDLFDPATARMLEIADRKILDGKEERLEIEHSIVIGEETRWLNDVKFAVEMQDGHKAIGGMAFDITDRKRAEEALVQYSGMQEILTKIASKYINIPLLEVENAIHQSLEEIGEFLKSDRVYVFDYLWKKGICRNTYEWCAAGIKPRINELKAFSLSGISWWTEIHQRGEIVELTDVMALPEDDQVRLFLYPEGVKSLLAIPVFRDNECVGFIGLDSVKKNLTYSKNEKVLLTLFAQMLVNVDKRIHLEMDLIAAKELAEESDKLKSAFINNISHEIRTPLNGILGFGQMLAQPGLSEDEISDYYETLQISSHRLMQTITDYMDMAMLSSGSMVVWKTDFLIGPLINEIVAKAREDCLNKDLILDISLPQDISNVILNSDRELIGKVLLKLIDNAIKFTGKGRIGFSVGVHNDQLEFNVEDTGKGIARDKLQAIFDMFTQEVSAMTRGHEGSGLGLSIARGMVDLLGGNIWVKSEKGKGSIFSISVPYDGSFPAGSAAISGSEKLPLSGKPLVLVAEDDESNYRYMEVIVKKAGCEYLHAFNGAEAVDLCRQHPEITFILMDIKMPVLNGSEALRQIRQFRADLPIIATTAYAQTGDKQRFFSEGFDDYFAKPVSVDQLSNLIKKYTSR